MTNAAKFLNMIAAETGCTDKNTVITLAMGVMVKSGVPVDVAMDTLMGEGSYKKLAGMVYDDLRAKAGL